jgi:hypothetical protein
MIIAGEWRGFNRDNQQARTAEKSGVVQATAGRLGPKRQPDPRAFAAP